MGPFGVAGVVYILLVARYIILRLSPRKLSGLMPLELGELLSRDLGVAMRVAMITMGTGGSNQREGCTNITPIGLSILLDRNLMKLTPFR